MNIKNLSSILSSFLAATLSYAAAIPVESDITEVSLFQDGALIIREAKIDVEAGKSLAHFKNLPSNVDRNALQAQVIEGSGVVVRNAKLFIPEDIEESPEIEELRKSLLKLDDERAAILKSQQQAKNRIAFAGSMGESFAKNFGTISEGVSLDVDQARKTWEYIQEITTKGNDEVAKLTNEIRLVDERIEDVKKDLDKTLQSFNKLKMVAEVELEAVDQTTITLAVGYIANEARWQPKYELRARPAEGLLDFGYFASVWQNTGEDWGDISLTLHTNHANRQGNAPELQPLRVNQSHYRPYYSKDLNAVQRTRVSSSLEMREEATKAELGEAVVSSSSVSFQVELPGAVDVPSSKDHTSLPLLETPLETEYWSEVVPKIQLDAYLKGKTVNKMDLPIMPGQAIAFVDDKLSSKVYLDKTLPEEDLELSLGVDANIAVKRREGVQKKSDSGFLDKTTTLRREFYNEVSNFHSVDHKVVVVDQFPVSQNAKIEVRRLGPSPAEVEFEKNEEEEQDLGIFKWDVSLKSKESKTFSTRYEVVYPRDWQLWPEL